jgi:hypothetical protein
MKPPISPVPRGVLEVDWAFFGEICRALALKVAREFDPEVVLGVAKAGVIPGVVVASILQREFTSMVVTRKDEGEEPVLIAGPPSTIRGRRVLIVDETLRYRQHDETGAERSPRAQAGNGQDGSFFQDRAIPA